MHTLGLYTPLDFELAFTVQTFKNQLLCFSSSLPLIRHINQLCIVWLQIINTLLCSKCCYVVIKPLISKQFIVKCLCNHGNWSLFETLKYRRLMLQIQIACELQLNVSQDSLFLVLLHTLRIEYQPYIPNTMSVFWSSKASRGNKVLPMLYMCDLCRQKQLQVRVPVQISNQLASWPSSPHVHCT